MSNFQRRDFLTGAAAFAAATTATLVGTRRAEAGDPSFMNNVPDPLLAGQGVADVQVRAGEVEGQGDRRAASARRRRSSSCRSPRGSPGVSMRLEPGAMRELHWHATAAEWAFVIEGRVRTTVIDPQGNAETNDFEPGRRLVFPSRPRPHARMPGRQADALHPDLRQRLLLGVRHLQHHRLDRPHPQAAPGEELRRPRVGLRRVPQGRGLLRPRGGAAARSRRPAPGSGNCRRRRTSFELLAQEPHASTRAAASGGSIPTGSRSRKTVTGVILDLEPGGLRELHWHPNADEWQYVIEGQGQRDDVRLARPVSDRDAREGRRRLHPAGVRPLDRERRRQAVPRPDRLQHRHLSRRSTCRSGSPGTRSTCWPPTSASRPLCSRSSRTKTCSSPTRTGVSSRERNGTEMRRVSTKRWRPGSGEHDRSGYQLARIRKAAIMKRRHVPRANQNRVAALMGRSADSRSVVI